VSRRQFRCEKGIGFIVPRVFVSKLHTYTLLSIQNVSPITQIFCLFKRLGVTVLDTKTCINTINLRIQLFCRPVTKRLSKREFLISHSLNEYPHCKNEMGGEIGQLWIGFDKPNL